MTGTPVISVVMPVWNAGSYLRPAIDSILTQTFGDFELIAVDDGSTDGSGAVLADAAAQDDRVRVITQPNRGLVDALNRGLGAVRGTYVARMDQDDLAWPDRFALQIARMQKEPDLMALGGQILLIDPEGRPLRRFAMPLTHDEIDDRHTSTEGMGLCHPATMLRAAALTRVGGYDPAYASAEDMDLWLRLAEVGRLANLEDCILSYRQHFGSLGYSRRHEQNLSAWRAARAAAERRGAAFSLPEPQTAQAAVISRANTARRWGWWALGGGNVATARRYAAQALVLRPFAADSWRLAYCALRGR